MHEMKQHKPWIDGECLGFLDQRGQAKMQWIQDSSQSKYRYPEQGKTGC